MYICVNHGYVDFTMYCVNAASDQALSFPNTHLTVRGNKTIHPE